MLLRALNRRFRLVATESYDQPKYYARHLTLHFEFNSTEIAIHYYGFHEAIFILICAFTAFVISGSSTSCKNESSLEIATERPVTGRHTRSLARGEKMMEKAYWLGRKRASLKLARDAAGPEARLIHCDLAGRYAVKAESPETWAMDFASSLPRAMFAAGAETCGEGEDNV